MKKKNVLEEEVLKIYTIYKNCYFYSKYLCKSKVQKSLLYDLFYDNILINLQLH